MKEITKLNSVQVRIYPQDSLPFQQLILDAPREELQKLFSFKTVEPYVRNEGLSGFRFSLGCYGDPPKPVEFVQIEERRIVIKLAGDSDQCTQFYKALVSELVKLAENRPIQEIVCTHETEVAIRLSMDYEQFFSPGLRSFLKKTNEKYFTTDSAKSFVLPSSMRFNVRFQLVDDELTKAGILLATKTFAIEPRAHTSLEDRIFWIRAPVDTSTCLKLIDDLEGTLAGNA